MQTYQLPDGNWATTPVYIGLSPIPTCCADDKHQWANDVKSPIPTDKDRPAGMKFMTMQICSLCKYRRVLLTKE